MARVIVFIDNSNVYKGLCEQRKSNPKVAWAKKYNPLTLAQKLTGNRSLERVMFYGAPPPQDLFNRDPGKYAAQNIYYEKISKLPKVEVKFATLTNNGGVITEKNLDTQLTADVILMAANNGYDHAIIITNDGDFISAVEGAKTQGKKVEVAHFKHKASMDLMKSADITRRLRPVHFVHIDEES